MSFFDSKEEVINIELTQYGKEKFAKGLFQPAYYEFFDDDIIYDLSWAGLSEDQNEIETRILEQSVYNKPIYNFSDRMKDNEKYDFFKSQPTNNLRVKDITNISTNKSNNNYTPAWDIKIYNGLAESYSKPTKQILEINLSDLLVTVSGNTIETLNIKVDDILLELKEENCISINDNFEVELFEIDETEKDDYGRDRLKRISFEKQPIYIKDGILLDEPIIPTQAIGDDSKKVEYFFKVTTDKKIDRLTLKALKEKEKKIYNDAVEE